jgi:hypothetical protein
MEGTHASCFWQCQHAHAEGEQTSGLACINRAEHNKHRRLEQILL